MGNGLDNLHGNSDSRTCNYRDRLSLLDVCDNSIKTISAVSSGLLEGTATKLCQYSSHIMDQPLVELWHGAESAAIGFGLASINKRLAWAFGALASGEMIYRGLAATNDSLPTILNLAATGNGYDETKQTVASKFGQLSADLIAMSATGAISGGCVIAARRGKIAWKEMKIVQKERAAGHYDSVFERMS
ncbi:MAG: hypothetical protein K2X29_02365, partial [Candidatus Obscuribacterales bacterium]|nr:hypothetical protein [Candidatus Obscuribacterales bacterium]